MMLCLFTGETHCSSSQQLAVVEGKVDMPRTRLLSLFISHDSSCSKWHRARFPFQDPTVTGVTPAFLPPTTTEMSEEHIQQTRPMTEKTAVTGRQEVTLVKSCGIRLLDGHSTQWQKAGNRINKKFFKKFVSLRDNQSKNEQQPILCCLAHSKHGNQEQECTGKGLVQEPHTPDKAV